MDSYKTSSAKTGLEKLLKALSPMDLNYVFANLLILSSCQEFLKILVLVGHIQQTDDKRTATPFVCKEMKQILLANQAEKDIAKRISRLSYLTTLLSAYFRSLVTKIATKQRKDKNEKVVRSVVYEFLYEMDDIIKTISLLIILLDNFLKDGRNALLQDSFATELKRLADFLEGYYQELAKRLEFSFQNSLSSNDSGTKRLLH